MPTKVTPLFGRTGQPVRNQYVIHETLPGDVEVWTFQSYRSIVARVVNDLGAWSIELDRATWNYSTRTSRYLNQLLRETLPAGRAMDPRTGVQLGHYLLTDLGGLA